MCFYCYESENATPFADGIAFSHFFICCFTEVPSLFLFQQPERRC